MFTSFVVTTRKHTNYVCPAGGHVVVVVAAAAVVVIELY